MSAHTPGPWDWVRVVARDRAGCETFKHALIGFVDAETPLAKCNSNEADACLIAAAPDLLSALEATAAALELFADVGCCDGDQHHEDKCKVGLALRNAEAAIARARGGA